AHFGGDASSDLHGRRAIEVAAMLTDSVVAVKHLTNPRTGKLSSTTMALFAVGGVSLLAAAGTFIKGVSVASDNKEAFEKWVDVDKQPSIDFRPIRLAPALDFVAVAGLLGGLACVGYGLARALDEKQSPYFRIGRGPHVEFPTDVVVEDEFPLVAPEGNDFVFSWSDGMKGEMTVDNQVTPLDRLPKTGPIPHKARIRVEAGNNTFFVSSVPAPRAPAGGFRLDSAVLLFALISFGLHGALVGLMYLLPADTRGYSNDDLDSELRTTRVQIK